MSNGNGSGPTWRHYFVALVLGAGALALTMRVGYLQVVQGAEYREQAREEHWSRQTLKPLRGAILDRNGHPLALSVTSYDISVSPRTYKTPEARDKAIKDLAQALEVPEPEIAGLVRGAGDRYSVLVRRQVDYNAGQRVGQAGIPGVLLEETGRRTYPEGALGSAVLGFLGRDGEGLSGLEADYNRDLGGIPGWVLFERDVIGDPIPFGFKEEVPAAPGGSLVLTLDRYIQRMVEQRLDEAVTRHNAIGGTILVMEAKTGAILAMATRPSYDVRALDLGVPSNQEMLRNRAITDMYEPGSTFKVLTVAAAINEGLVTPDTRYYDAGPINRGGWMINTWNGAHYGWETMTEMLQHSNNIGAVWAAEKLGKDRFYQYVRGFGFGQRTNLGLSGEALGQLRWPDDPTWSTIDLATNSFGQGINVTPVQMITAVAAVVNGGNLMRPYLVKAVDTPQGMRTYQPVTVRRVISEETASKVRLMMNAVAQGGETKLANVPGYKVGGKTGTASVPKPGGYTQDDTIASFVGFAPLEDPQFVALVRIDEPKDSPWGSVVASPLFSDVARDILAYWRTPPTEPVELAAATSTKRP
ncbi:MAG: penicillin-binding transpeptidase domain-containing protein [Chloroflexi bacterium]|nr:penicillin-binding transpeptidase domain-containing protein [Chloroflexota bacterium]